MRSTMARRTGLTLPAALLLSLVLAGQAAAAAWSSPLALTSSGNGWAGDLVTLGASTAVAVYEDGGRVFVRRSTNSGASWAPRVRLSADGQYPAISGRGSKVDVAWVRGHTVRYARSTNSGASFGASVVLANPAFLAADQVDVARGPSGRVAVSWTEVSPGMGSDESRVRVRVSTNGGASFGKTKTLATSARGSTVAAGKGVIYVAYSKQNGSVQLRRSRDSGGSWTPATTITRNGEGAQLTASGAHAYIGYAQGSAASWVRYRRSTNKGATWTSPVNLSSSTGRPSYSLHMSLKSGVVRAAFERCLDAACDTSGVFYRQSSNGTSWTAAEKVSTDAGRDAHPAGVGFAGRIIVLYGIHVGLDGYLDPNVYVRTGAP
jgi:hypothetical protein